MSPLVAVVVVPTADLEQNSPACTPAAQAGDREGGRHVVDGQDAVRLQDLLEGVELVRVLDALEHQRRRADVRDALESTLWYMRLEGGRYRFTSEPNLNKVVLERLPALKHFREVEKLGSLCDRPHASRILTEILEKMPPQSELTPLANAYHVGNLHSWERQRKK